MTYFKKYRKSLPHTKTFDALEKLRWKRSTLQLLELKSLKKELQGESGSRRFLSPSPHNGNGNQTLKEAKEQIEKALILEALAQHKNNLTKTAEKLGISRPTLYELMDKLGIARK